MLRKAQGRFGIKVDDPQWIEIPKNLSNDPKGRGYIDGIKADLYPKDTLIVLVLISNKDVKSYIKREIDALGVPS